MSAPLPALCLSFFSREISSRRAKKFNERRIWMINRLSPAKGRAKAAAARKTFLALRCDRKSLSPRRQANRASQSGDKKYSEPAHEIVVCCESLGGGKVPAFESGESVAKLQIDVQSDLCPRGWSAVVGLWNFTPVFSVDFKR